MISSRMLSIIQYMQIHPTTSYKELAADLHLKERSVRYDIDRLNDILSLEGLPEIERQSKGVLVYPEGLVLDSLSSNSEFVYSNEERMSLLLLILLIRQKDFKINQLSRKLQVSRSTIKNDISSMQEMLAAKGLGIEYTDHFSLVGSKKQRVTLLNNEFKKYIDLLINPPTSFNAFEYFCIHIINSAFQSVSIPQIILCVNEMLEANSCVLTDESYRWYLSSIMVLVWFVIHDKEYPLDTEGMADYDPAVFEVFREKLGQLVGKPIDERNTRILARFLDFTNKYARLYSDVDLIDAETVVYTLIERMSSELGFPFEQDRILVDGLLGHIIPLLQRIRNRIIISDQMASMRGGEEQPVLNLMKRICRETAPLNELESEDEAVYLSIYFLASIRRMQNTPPKRVLLVCGHGYGTTTMLKETLLSEYQIKIVDTLPVYRLVSDPDWMSIDYVIATTKLNNDLPKPSVVVNPIPTPADYAAIEQMGISRKKILSNYFAIEQKLCFLQENDRKRVMEIIEKEFGYQSVSRAVRTRDFSSLLKYDCVRINDGGENWREAVRAAGKPLMDRGFIEERYVENILDTMENIGFYSVSDDSFALLHGKENEGVNQTSISLIVNREPVTFGDKAVRIVFCLAAKNARDHLPAIITLMRMVKTTTLIRDLESAETVDEIYQSILQHEMEVS